MAAPDFGEITEKLRRSTVEIHVGNRGVGSGVIWSGDGTIITNAHVARGREIRVRLWDRREFHATVASRDAQKDLAALRVSAVGLPAASIADSEQVRAGELAIAIGNPLGFIGALTTGVVHAVGPIRGLGSQAWIQANVRLAPGNSGGPLADGSGRVIGINTMVAGRLALAVPCNVVRQFVTAGPSDGWLGVAVQPVRIPASRVAGGVRSTFGLLIVELESGSPASFGSLLPGDILLGTEHRAFASPDDLWQSLQGSGPRLLRLEFLRGDYSRVRRVTVQIGIPRVPENLEAA